MTTPILSATNVEEQDSTTTSSTTTSRDWTEVASGIWAKSRPAPKYPKNLTESEIHAQAKKAFADNTPEKVIGVEGGEVKETREVPRGIGLMMRLTQLDSDKIFAFEYQFDMFVHNVASDIGRTPWTTWKHAWADFAEYAGLNTLAHRVARLKEGFPA